MFLGILNKSLLILWWYLITTIGGSIDYSVKRFSSSKFFKEIGEDITLVRDEQMTEGEIDSEYVELFSYFKPSDNFNYRKFMKFSKKIDFYHEDECFKNAIRSTISEFLETVKPLLTSNYKIKLIERYDDRFIYIKTTIRGVGFKELKITYHKVLISALRKMRFSNLKMTSLENLLHLSFYPLYAIKKSNAGNIKSFISYYKSSRLDTYTKICRILIKKNGMTSLVLIKLVNTYLFNRLRELRIDDKGTNIYTELMLRSKILYIGIEMVYYVMNCCNGKKIFTDSISVSQHEVNLSLRKFKKKFILIVEEIKHNPSFLSLLEDVEFIYK